MLFHGDRGWVVKNFWKGHSKITGLVTQLKTSNVSGVPDVEVIKHLVGLNYNHLL